MIKSIYLESLGFLEDWGCGCCVWEAEFSCSSSQTGEEVRGLS